jgi:hypothetical protein
VLEVPAAHVDDAIDDARRFLRRFMRASCKNQRGEREQEADRNPPPANSVPLRFPMVPVMENDTFSALVKRERLK